MCLKTRIKPGGDHGWHLGDLRVWGKHTCYDVSLRSPLIIKHPNMQKGIKYEGIVSSVDIYPTLMDFCGVQIPQKVDGRSLKPLLTKASKNEKNVAYSYFNKGMTQCVMTAIG